MGLPQYRISQLECNKDANLADYLNVIETLIKIAINSYHTTR